MHPESDRPWRIEMHGSDVIPEADRHVSPADLFRIWFAASISVAVTRRAPATGPTAAELARAVAGFGS